MAESKGKRTKRRAESKHAEPKQLVVTFAKGDVVKIESLDAAGERAEVSEKEMAQLFGADEIANLEMALEEAYAAGIEDAVDDSVEDDLDEGEEAMLREAEARRLLRRGVRRLVVLRALKRGAARKRVRSDHNGAETASAH